MLCHATPKRSANSCWVYLKWEDSLQSCSLFIGKLSLVLPDCGSGRPIHPTFNDVGDALLRYPVTLRQCGVRNHLGPVLFPNLVRFLVGKLPSERRP